MLKFDLQLFTEENDDSGATVEIPAELEGLSPEIAAEIMKEIPEEESAPEKNREGKEPEMPTDEDAELENQPESKVKEPAQEEKTPPISIPYERFKEVNEKQKAANEEVARLKAELESLKKQPGTQASIPPNSQSAFNPVTDLTPAFTDMVRKEARDRAKLLTGFTDEQIKEFESEYADHSPEKKKWEESIQALIPLIAVEAKELVMQQEAQAAEQQRVYKLAYDEYGQLAETVKSWPDKEAIWSHVSGSYFAALPESEQIALSSAYRNAESGHGSLQDVQYIKYHLNKAAVDYRAAQQEADIPKPEKPKPNKLEQMKAHPKAEQIGGAPNPGEITAAELERMMNTTPWEKMPPEYRKILLEQ